MAVAVGASSTGVLNGDGSATTFDIASWTPDGPVLVFIVQRMNPIGETITSVAGNGLTWTEIDQREGRLYQDQLRSLLPVIPLLLLLC